MFKPLLKTPKIPDLTGANDIQRTLCDHITKKWIHFTDLSNFRCIDKFLQRAK